MHSCFEIIQLIGCVVIIVLETWQFWTFERKLMRFLFFRWKKENKNNWQWIKSCMEWGQWYFPSFVFLLASFIYYFIYLDHSLSFLVSDHRVWFERFPFGFFLVRWCGCERLWNHRKTQVCTVVGAHHWFTGLSTFNKTIAPTNMNHSFTMKGYDHKWTMVSLNHSYGSHILRGNSLSMLYYWSWNHPNFIQRGRRVRV